MDPDPESDSEKSLDPDPSPGKKLTKEQCWGSVTFRRGSWSADPYIWLTDPDPTPDPTPFFSDFKDAKKIFFLQIFSFNLHITGTLKFYFASMISVQLSSLREKGRIRILITTGTTNGSGSGRPKKTCGSCGSGSPTLLQRALTWWRHRRCRCPSRWRRPRPGSCQSSSPPCQTGNEDPSPVSEIWYDFNNWNGPKKIKKMLPS